MGFWLRFLFCGVLLQGNFIKIDLALLMLQGEPQGKADKRQYYSHWKETLQP